MFSLNIYIYMYMYVYVNLFSCAVFTENEKKNTCKQLETFP